MKHTKNTNPFSDVPYVDLDDAQQAHVDAASDDQERNDDVCLCGKPIDVCPDAYDHISHGF